MSEEQFSEPIWKIKKKLCHINNLLNNKYSRNDEIRVIYTKSSKDIISAYKH